MMKTLLTLAFLLFSNIIFAQYTLIPDGSFERRLITLNYDTIFDGKVRTSNIENVTELTIINSSASDLTGIEDFKALTSLDCENCRLTNLNLSQNIKLKTLLCDYNPLITLDLSQNTALENLSCFNTQLSSLDLSQNIELKSLSFKNLNITNLDLSNNPKLYFLQFENTKLTSLDLSKNTMLIDLYCRYNQLTSINISKSLVLKVLDCTGNKLSDLDLSNNTILRELKCSNNLLTSLDLNKNTKLNYLYCGTNQLTSLDLTQNSALNGIYCNDNQLKSLRLDNNGNILNIKNLFCHNNPNLLCITVDNPMYSIFKWTNTNYFKKDEWSQYTDEICGTNVISGNTFYDSNLNCTKETTEKGMRKIVVKAHGESDFYASTDNSGNYRILVDSNKTYNVNAVAFTDLKLMKSSCPDSGFVVNSGVGETITANKNFALDIKQCAMLEVEIAKGELRRCFPSSTVIWYKNIGTMDETNAKIFVDYPEYLKIVSANKTYNLFDAEKNIYVFDIGTISSFGSETINIVDSVICGDESIRGLTQCIKAWITPKSYCAETKDTTAWDKSSIKVLEAKCIKDSVALFVIVNEGTGDMQTAQEYRFYYNNEFAHKGTFQLKSGESLAIDVTADGSTIRLEADQHPLHPGNSHPRTTLEACGAETPDKVSLNFWTQIPNDDLDFDVAEVCLEIVDSYDPNDKKVLPAGILAEHYVSETEELKYTIRFQNTGSAEAIKIMVVDTLSESLDISTLNILGASHAYDYNVTGTNSKVLSFTFNNINLPDSTTNEAASHGFVSFSISPIQGIAKGTKIENFADIYFDFNSAVRTDTAWVTALDTVIVSDKIITVTEQSTLGISNVKVSKVQIYPVPTNDYLFVKNANSEFSKIEIFDIKGSLILTEKLISDEQKINVNSLQKGIYFIHLSNENGEKRTFKMVK